MTHVGCTYKRGHVISEKAHVQQVFGASRYILSPLSPHLLTLLFRAVTCSDREEFVRYSYMTSEVTKVMLLYI